MFYNINKQELSSKKLNRELLKNLGQILGKELNRELSRISLVPKAKELNRELVNSTFISNKELLHQIRNRYKVNKLVQVIIIIKTLKYYKLLLVYNSAKIELGDYKVINRQLYIAKRLFILDLLELKIRIIEKLYISRLARHVGRLVIYNKINAYYYQPRITDTI